MTGEIEEPFRFNFQADLLNSGSLSFGRFESESLSWERRSSFSHNRYLEEVEKYSKPGSVTEKKAYFEAHFKRKALLKQSCSESQDLQESENGNESNHFTCSNPCKYDEKTENQKSVNENVETLCSENGNESSHVSVLEESLRDLNYDGSEIQDQKVSGPEQLKPEETHNVVLVKRIISSIANASPIAETKQLKPKLKTRASYAQVQRIVPSESSKAKTRESKGLFVKENEKKSPRLARSPVTHSGMKTSKLEESNMSLRKAKILPPNKSIVKEYRSEKTTETKSLPGALQPVNRTKQTFITPSKPHVNQSGAGFTFKSDQRAERRKEEIKTAELIQSRKSLNFKATPMPSFYRDFVHSSDQNKVSSSKTPNRPRTSSVTPTTNKTSAARPSSSTSLANKNRPSELPKKIYVPEKRVQDKKKDSSSQKQKDPEVTKGTRARDPKLVSA